MAIPKRLTPVKHDVREVKDELMYVVEHPTGEVTMLLDEAHMSTLDDGEQMVLLRALFTMAKDKLMQDAEDAEATAGLERSADPAHEPFVACMSLLVSSRGIFDMAVYFGGRARTDISWSEGLVHCAQLIAKLESEMLD